MPNILFFLQDELVTTYISNWPIFFIRYGSYYYEVMTNLDKYYPGMEALISQNDLSIQAQESHQLMAASDQRGEQTINRGAKTLGIIFSLLHILLMFLIM